MSKKKQDKSKKQSKNEQHGEAKPPQSLGKKMVILKAMGQIAVALIGGAADPVTTKIIENFGQSNKPNAVQVDPHSAPPPKCTFEITVKKNDGTTIAQRFEAYDEQLCAALAEPIIKSNLQEPVELPVPVQYPYYEPDGTLKLDNHDYQSFIDEFVSSEPKYDLYKEAVTVGLNFGETPLYINITQDNVPQIVDSIYPNVDEQSKKAWVGKVLGNLNSIDEISISRLLFGSPTVENAASP
jgi:hypothetical protein